MARPDPRIEADAHTGIDPTDAPAKQTPDASDVESQLEGLRARLRQAEARAEMFRRVAERERRVRRLLESNVMGIFFFDTQGGVSEANDAFLDLLGYTREDLRLGRIRWTDYLSVECAGRDRQAKQELLKTGITSAYESELVHRDGHRIPVLTGAASFDDSHREGVAFVLDLSERKRVEAALRQSEARMRRLMEANILAMTFWDTDGRVFDANDAFLQLLGYTRDDLNAGKISWKEYVVRGNEHDRRNRAARKELYTTGICKPYESEVRRKDGSAIPVMTGAAAFDSTLRQGVSFQLDLSGRKKIEDALRERESRIRHLIDNSLIGVSFWERDGRITDANEAFLRLIGYTRDELVRGEIHWTNYSTPESRAPRQKLLKQAQPGSMLPIYEKEFIRKDGTRVPVLVGTSFFEGTVERGVSFVVDLTEQKRGEAALRRAHEGLEVRVEERTRELRLSNEQLAREIGERQHAEAVLAERSEDLARSNAELEQFAYVASHDLQEPLRMVGSYMQLLRRRYHDKLDESAQEFIGYAVDGATRMQALIDDLLTYSRVGTTTRPFARVDLDAVLRHTLATLDAPIRESGAKIDAQRLPAVTGDAGQLGQLFQNLIGNALKFRGEAPPQVNIDVVPDGDHWRFSVRDNGIGIAPEYKDRIFVMFQRLHTRREYAGTGIGLAICKKIVERHGGHIWVEPNPQGGSVFQFTMPRADPA